MFSIVAFFLLVFYATRGGMTGSPVTIDGEGVGVVEIKGTIQDPEEILKALREFKQNENVKAVVVRIDSPGGAVGASQEIYQEIKRVDADKPVVASLGNIAASGGYYVALGARYIVANPGTVTGSIGVIMKIPNFKQLLKKVGIDTTVIKSGKLKDLGSVTRELSEEEKRVLEEVMNDVHLQFMEDVSASRQIPQDRVRTLADGRIFSGRQALKEKLVDELGNFSVAIDKAASLASLEGEPQLIYPKKDRFFIFREMLENEGARIIQKALEGILVSEEVEYLNY